MIFPCVPGTCWRSFARGWRYSFNKLRFPALLLCCFLHCYPALQASSKLQKARQNINSLNKRNPPWPHFVQWLRNRACQFDLDCAGVQFSGRVPKSNMATVWSLESSGSQKTQVSFDSFAQFILSVRSKIFRALQQKECVWCLDAEDIWILGCSYIVSWPRFSGGKPHQASVLCYGCCIDEIV